MSLTDWRSMSVGVANDAFCLLQVHCGLALGLSFFRSVECLGCRALTHVNDAADTVDCFSQHRHRYACKWSRDKLALAVYSRYIDREAGGYSLGWFDVAAMNKRPPAIAAFFKILRNCGM